MASLPRSDDGGNVIQLLPQWPALGYLLVRNGAVTADALEDALAARTPGGPRLGDLLVERGACTATDVAMALAEQHEMPFLDVLAEPAELTPTEPIPEDVARRYEAVAIRVDDDGVEVVAVADPTNVLAADELRVALGRPVRLVVAPYDQIRLTLRRLYESELIEIVTPDDAIEELLDDTTLIDGDTSSAPVAFVNRILVRALDLGASDLHFSPQGRQLVVRARVDGVMRQVAAVSGAHAPAVISRIKIMGGLDIAERRIPQDGRVSIRRGEETIDVRAAVLPTVYGEKATLRILSSGQAPPTLSGLGMWPRAEEELRRAIGRPFGAVVVVGPTGSGKTTTLHAALREINRPDISIVTLEDPVEYRTPGLDQIEVNPRAGVTFAGGLRTILRSDPDIILVGEMRDEETAQIAFRAAMTGHLVLTTLHAQTAAAAVQRLLDMGVDRPLVTSAISCLVSQRLVRCLCDACAAEAAPTEEEREALGPFAEDIETIRHPVGCAACGHTGYRGRAAVFEVMPFDEALQALVGASVAEIQAAAVGQGMFTLREDGMRLVAAGRTTVDEIRRVAGDVIL